MYYYQRRDYIFGYTRGNDKVLLCFKYLGQIVDRDGICLRDIEITTIAHVKQGISWSDIVPEQTREFLILQYKTYLIWSRNLANDEESAGQELCKLIIWEDVYSLHEKTKSAMQNVEANGTYVFH